MMTTLFAMCATQILLTHLGRDLMNYHETARAAVLAVELAACVLIGVAGKAQAGGVLRVGPTRQYTSIQTAVAAASAGDLILVDQGSYAPFDVIGKGVSILSALSNQPFTLSASNTRPVVRVIAIPPGQSVTIMGWRTSVQFGAMAALWIQNCAGPVRIRDAVLDPTADLINVPMRAVVEITNSASVSLFDLRVAPAVSRNGRTTTSASSLQDSCDNGLGISAMIVSNSSVHLSRCVLRGYDNLGPPSTGRWGGDGLRLLGACVIRLDDAPTFLTGGRGAGFGGSAVHLIARQASPNVVACALPTGAFVPGSGPKPGGELAVNHDRGRVGGFQRIVPNCIFESAGHARAPARMAANQTHTLSVTSFFPRAYLLFAGPSGLQRLPGIENTSYLDFASPYTLLVGYGALGNPPTATLRVTIPKMSVLVGFQFATQAVLGVPAGQTVPAASFSMAEIVVITP